tara:strand:- start:1261 stop:1449 length:189 start_codon:yes stop_codon:yes gene_type:complete
MKKILPYLKHLFFLIAIGLIPAGWNEASRIRGIRWEEMSIFLAISFVIIFFLWKSNYFTRNK